MPEVSTLVNKMLFVVVDVVDDVAVVAVVDVVDVVALPLKFVAVKVFVLGLYVNGVVVSSTNKAVDALAVVLLNGI